MGKEAKLVNSSTEFVFYKKEKVVQPSRNKITEGGWAWSFSKGDLTQNKDEFIDDESF